MEKKAYVERIMAFITNQQTGRKEEGGEPAPVPPEPESWTIDGVTYYNRCVFDLEEIFLSIADNATKYFNILTATELQEEPTSSDPAYIMAGDPHMQQGKRRASLHTQHIAGIDYPISTYYNGEFESSYTNRAYQCVDSKSEATNEYDIVLPTCSAYYGFLSEDGKTFISYFNLKD